MKYIVNNEEVSRDTFYFCKRAKEENKTFALLNPNNDVQANVNYHPKYDYFIIDKLRIYYTKGEVIVKEWFDKYYRWSECTVENRKERYNKSKIKSETKYEIKRYNIPTQEDFEEKEVKTKLFSVIVKNDDTVKTINKIRDERGNFSIKYVLRDNNFTEIIYEDTYKEI